MAAEVATEKIGTTAAIVLTMAIHQVKRDQDTNTQAIAIIMDLNHLNGERLKIRPNQVKTTAQKNLIMFKWIKRALKNTIQVVNQTTRKRFKLAVAKNELLHHKNNLNTLKNS